MATICYALLFLSSLVMPCTADYERSGSESGSESGSGSGLRCAVPSNSSGLGSASGSSASCQAASSCPAKRSFEDRFDAIEAAVSAIQQITSRMEKSSLLKAHYKGCKALAEAGYNTPGVYKIHPDGQNETEVYCTGSKCGYGDGWTVFQRRIDGSVDFYRNWANYTHGFGDVAGEHWLGLDLVHSLTADDKTELLIEMETINETASAHYSNFSLGDVSSNYTLSVSGFTSDPTVPGDALTKDHNGYAFSTFDRDNTDGGENSSEDVHGAWWFDYNVTSSLNGGYNYTNDKSIFWGSWGPVNESFRAVRMMLRPK